MTILHRTADFGTNFGPYRKLIRPNRSLSRRGLRLLVAAYAAMSVGIGLGFGLAMGAWLILPFVGLEIAVIATVCWMVLRRVGDYELLIVDAEKFRVIRRCQQRRTCYEFQRYWARIALAQGESGWYPSRLFVTSHGRTVEFGAAMSEEERCVLAQELKDLLRR